MEKQFISYELALELKELGFDEFCFTFFKKSGFLNHRYDTIISNRDINKDSNFIDCTAPLWQQAFLYLWNKTGRYIIPIPNEDKEWLCMGNKYKSYEESRLECLKKLIEIVKNESK